MNEKNMAIKFWEWEIKSLPVSHIAPDSGRKTEMSKRLTAYKIMMSVVMLLTMLLSSSRASAAGAVDSGALKGFYLAEKSDFITGQWPRLVSGAHYHYSTAEIPTDMISEDDPARYVAYSRDAICLRFKGLDPDAKFKLRVVYLSNSEGRVFALTADDEVLQEKITLPFGKKMKYVLDLPPFTYQDEKVEIKVINRQGINAVLSGIELWGDKEKPLLYLEPNAAGDFYGNINGLVKDATGRAVAGAWVELKLEGSQQVFKIKTDAEGRFSFTAPQQWRDLPDEWIHISAVKGKLHGHEIIPMMEVFILRLSPKPNWVDGTEMPHINLNGTWRFKSKAVENPAQPNLNLKDWANIQVPGEWLMQGFTVDDNTPASYRRQIAIPFDWADRRVKVRFDAVFSDARIWFNGKYVGHHMSTFTPFEVDVTEAVTPGKMNTLALNVISESLAEDLTAGKIMVGHQMGGIIRRVSAFAVPKVNIASFHVGTTFDEDYRDATIEVLLEIANESCEDAKDIAVDFKLSQAAPGSKQVNIKPESFELAKTIKAGEYIKRDIRIPVEAPKHWNAENPNLYLLDCTLNVGGKAVQSARQRFGFRQLEIRGPLVFLNGKLIRLRGVARQDSHPLMGRTVPEDILRKDMEIMAWANINNTYTCAFSPDEEVLNLADEMGFYMMEEPGTCWVGVGYFPQSERQKNFKGPNDPRMYQEYLRPVLEMIQRSRSHPCVLTWMLADESQFGPNFHRILERIHELDPSRPIHFAWDPKGNIFDIGSYHYPGYKVLKQVQKSKHPVIFDQFCHIYRIRPELMVDPGIRDEWVKIFVPYWESIWDIPAMWGGQVFNFTDDVFLMPSGEVRGYGLWGVIDPWRRVKPEVWHIKKTYSPAKIHDETKPLPVPDSGEPIRIKVENRYDFTNLGELLIEWSLGDESGKVQADIPPHSIGTISILPESRDYEGKNLELNFYRKGLMVDTYKLSIGRADVTESASSGPSAPIKLVDTEDAININAGDFRMVFDQSKGQIRRAAVKDKIVLVGGPVLMILPEADEVHTSGWPTPKPQVSPNNETCHDWKAEKVTAGKSQDGVEIIVEGSYREADGEYRLHIDGTGTITIDYHFKTKFEIHARQIGIVLYVPKSLETLSWKRQGQWSVYPDEHIGRSEGVARPFRSSDWPKQIDARTAPPWPWYLGSNALGTRDFRAARSNILRASLMDDDGGGIVVESDGTQQCRAFVDGDRIGMVISDYYVTGTGDFPWAGLRLELFGDMLSKGSVVEGTVKIRCKGK